VNGNSGHLQAQCHSSTNGRSSELINYWELHFSYQTGLVALPTNLLHHILSHVICALVLLL